MTARAQQDPLATPLSIYEVHLGSWMRIPEEGNRWLTYSELAIKAHPIREKYGLYPCRTAADYRASVRRIMGLSDHRLFRRHQPARHLPKTSWPLSIRRIRPDIGVLMDWTPAHFPDDPHGLSQFDGTHLYDHADPRLGYHPDWHSRIFNYDRVEVRNFLLNSGLFWLDRYHIDGLRVDAVASMLYLDYGRKEGEWIPNQFGGHENIGAVTLLKDLNVSGPS